MPKLKEKLDDIKGKAFELALIPVGFIVQPIALYLLRKAQIRRGIANDVSITSEWKKFNPKPPLKIRNAHQSILLHIKGCWHDLHGTGLKLPDGRIINPQIEVSDEDGNIYHMKSGWYFGMPDKGVEKFNISEAAFSYNLPKNKTYTEVRVRSDEDFLCDGISWYDYNLK